MDPEEAEENLYADGLLSGKLRSIAARREPVLSSEDRAAILEAADRLKEGS